MLGAGPGGGPGARGGRQSPQAGLRWAGGRAAAVGEAAGPEASGPRREGGGCEPPVPARGRQCGAAPAGHPSLLREQVLQERDNTPARLDNLENQNAGHCRF